MTFEEIKREPKFKADSPVTLETYGHMLGYYKLPKEECACCYSSNDGHLCNQLHAYGIVVVGKDGNVSVIGNCCAKNHFHVDTDIRADVARANNHFARMQRVESVRNLLEFKHERMATLNSLSDDAIAASQKLYQHIESMGPNIKKSLSDMEKTGKTSIDVKTIHVREGKDENGRVTEERESIVRRIGSAKGLSVLKHRRLLALIQKQKAIISAYDDIESVENDISLADIRRIQGKLGLLQEVVAGFRSYLDNVDDFMRNDLTAFCFLTSDIKERKTLAKFILSDRGELCGSGPAREFIQKLEQQIINEYDAAQVKTV